MSIERKLAVDTPVFYGINFEKRRRTKKIVEKIQRKNRKVVVTNEKLDVPAHWVAWVYKIPKFLRISQGSRTFKIIETQSAGGFTVKSSRKKSKDKIH